MRFGQWIEYNYRNFFLNNHAENEAVWIVPARPLFFLKKALY